MNSSGDIRTLPLWLKLLLLIAGAALMLTAADVIPADPARFKTPHWVLFVAGFAFLSVGILAFLAEHRRTHPARYLFMVGALVTSMFLVAAAVSVYASGTVIAIGPILIKGAAADSISRFMYGVGAVILAVIAVAVWLSWFRAMKSSSAAPGGRPTRSGHVVL